MAYSKKNIYIYIYIFQTSRPVQVIFKTDKLDYHWSPRIFFLGLVNHHSEVEWDHPFNTSANFSQFLTPTSQPLTVFSLLSVGKFGKFLTPSPLKNANVLNGWSQSELAQFFSHSFSFSDRVANKSSNQIAEYIVIDSNI